MLIPITTLDDERLRDFVNLTDVQLRKSLESANGLYLAESPKVIHRAIAAGHTPRAFLIREEWRPTLEDVIARFPQVPVYVGTSEQLAEVTGFNLHRGALASMHRPTPQPPQALLESARRLVVLDGLSDHTNVGAIFRSAAALGVDGILLSPECADPLYRRSVRVSMGAVLQIPWARLPDWRIAGPMMREHGFELVGLGLNKSSEQFEDFLSVPPEKCAFVFGSEGPGLSRRALAACTRHVTIRMDNSVDSLNVASAAAVVLWAVRHADEIRGSDDQPR